jgi:GxxExxY protein
MKTDFILLDEAANYYPNTEYLLSDECYQIIGACMEVHNELGKGFLEVVYKDALEIEFKARNIPYERESMLLIYYKDQLLPRRYSADFFVFNEIILEVKAQAWILDEMYKQTINYLSASKKQLGLLVNFGENSLQYKRVIHTK